MTTVYMPTIFTNVYDRDWCFGIFLSRDAWFQSLRSGSFVWDYWEVCLVYSNLALLFLPKIMEFIGGIMWSWRDNVHATTQCERFLFSLRRLWGCFSQYIILKTIKKRFGCYLWRINLNVEYNCWRINYTIGYYFWRINDTVRYYL